MGFAGHAAPQCSHGPHPGCRSDHAPWLTGRRPSQKGGPPALPLPGATTGDEVVANCFTSLRAIATYDWMDFFEHVSRVEQILRSDPADVYAGMDRTTRNRYRKVIEELALATGQSELEVARMAITLAQAACRAR